MKLLSVNFSPLSHYFHSHRLLLNLPHTTYYNKFNPLHRWIHSHIRKCLSFSDDLYFLFHRKMRSLFVRSFNATLVPCDMYSHCM
jgi:hypothetical protein